LTAALVVASTAALATGAVAAAQTQTAWVTPPAAPVPAGTVWSALADVAVAAPADVWAVGSWSDTASHPLAVRWDGARWSRSTVPSVVGPVRIDHLTAVDGVAADQIWAVGVGAAGTADAAVIVRYDGRAWSAYPLPPSQFGSSSALSGIDMLQRDEGWAVGDVMTGTGTQPLILHWRQGTWVRVPAPAIDGPATLESVTAGTETDAWAVGKREVAGRPVPLTLHWNGVAWTEVAVPDPGRAGSLVSVSGSTGNIWAVGSSCDATAPADCLPLVLHRVGDAWEGVPTRTGDVVFSEVLASADGQVWLIGFVRTLQMPQLDHVEYWNGDRFVTDSGLPSVPPDVDAGGKPASAMSLAAADLNEASSVIWAVGWAQGATRVPHAVYRQ
jgi:hypothetical protein